MPQRGAQSECLRTRRRFRRPARGGSLGAAARERPLLAAGKLARGPDQRRRVAEKLIDAVVNISTSQT